VSGINVLLEVVSLVHGFYTYIYIVYIWFAFLYFVKLPVYKHDAYKMNQIYS